MVGAASDAPCAMLEAGGRGLLEFADVEVRRNGNDDERWVSGSFAVRDQEGALGSFRDF